MIAPVWWPATELRRRPGKIGIPEVVTERAYDLVVLGSPTWWLSTNVPILGTKRGGEYVDGVHFRYQGGQVRSLLSLISYLGSGEYRKRYLSVPIPPTNIQDYHLETACTFADGLADRLLSAPPPQRSRR